MADKPEQFPVPITSEKVKNPKRVEAGKRLQAISKIAKERKKKQVESSESSSSNNIVTYIGIVIALVSLALAYKSNQREEKAFEPKHTPQTVTVRKKPNVSTMDTLE